MVNTMHRHKANAWCVAGNTILTCRDMEGRLPWSDGSVVAASAILHHRNQTMVHVPGRHRAPGDEIVPVAANAVIQRVYMVRRFTTGNKVVVTGKAVIHVGNSVMIHAHREPAYCVAMTAVAFI